MNLNWIDLDFETLTGFSPRQFQRETIAHLCDRQNVILRAPTGSGKTETAIAPFLFAQTRKLDFPKKLIYAVPLRTLANSLRQRCDRLVQNWMQAYPLPRPPVVTLQTGENPEDPRFEGDIVFCTIDQMLSSFLNIPYSVGRGSANVNAGAMFASYLVFDELHLLDPNCAFATLLKVLQDIRGIAPFLLMTATMTDALIEQVEWEAAQSLQRVAVGDEDLAEIEGNRARTFRRVCEPLTAQRLYDDIRQHRRRRVIAIGNTVAQVQALYRDLRDLVAGDAVALTLLHSRFLPEDRERKEAYLAKTFARDWRETGRCEVLISTQAIEAGIDITCEAMHVHLCPMNSLLQRAGRCARYRGEVGEVFVYPSFGETSDGEEAASQQRFLPYDNEPCDRTWDVLQHHGDGVAGFRIEEDWVNRVHTAETQLRAQQRQHDRAEFDRYYNAAVWRGDRSAAQALIRWVDNRSLFVWEEEAAIIDFDSDPEEIDPAQLQAFSIPASALAGIWREFERAGSGGDWLLKRIEAPRGGDAETYSQPVCSRVTSLSGVLESVRLLVNPRYVAYDPLLGLSMGARVRGNGFQSPQKSQRRKTSEYRYRMDTYVGHLGNMWRCWREAFAGERVQNGVAVPTRYASVREELSRAGGRYLQRRILTAATEADAVALFEYLVFLAIWTHDLGKLQLDWQKVVRGWQKYASREFGARDPRSHLLAHTDYDPADGRRLDGKGRTQQQAWRDYQRKYRRPTHAVESAYLAQEVLQHSLVPLWRDRFGADAAQCRYLMYIVMLAAGRHHSAWAAGWTMGEVRRIGEIELHPHSSEAILRSWRRLAGGLALVGEEATLSCRVYPLRGEFLLTRLEEEGRMEYLQLYWLVVRALRLCDGRSVV